MLEAPPSPIDSTDSFVWKAWFRKLQDYMNAATAGNKDNQPRMNLVLNGASEFWQSGVTTVPAAATGNTHCDGFKFATGPGFAQYQHTRIPTANTLLGFTLAQRWVRNAASADTSACVLLQNLESADCYRLQGKKVTLSFWIRVGSGWTGSQHSARIVFGQGVDQDRTAVVYTNETFVQKSYRPNTSWTKITVSADVPLLTSQICVFFVWSHAGVAPANDYFDITGIQLEVGEVASDYFYENQTLGLLRCQRRYFKTFEQSQSPGTAVGIQGAHFCQQVGGAGVAQVMAVDLRFPVPMRITPTITTYNPSVNNAAIRNTTIAADWTGVATTPSTNGVILQGAPPVGSAAGQTAVVHVTADARL